MARFIIPPEIYDPLFFDNKDFDADLLPHEIFDGEALFIYEVAYYAGIASIKPWETPDEYIPVLLREWDQLQHEIQTLFKKREKRATLVPMKKAIGYFIEFLFWSNQLPAKKMADFDADSLQVKPVNLLERLHFLNQRPTLYPSFIQLIELFEEQKKQYYKRQAIMSTSQKNGEKGIKN